MGASASIDSDLNVLTIPLKKLPEAIEESVFVYDRFPLIIDPTEQAGRFLKYQLGSFILSDDPTVTKLLLNRSLVGALQHGRTLTLKFATLEPVEVLKKLLFEDNMFPEQVLSRPAFYNDAVWRSLIKPQLGDPDPQEMTISQEFVFSICTTSDFVPPELTKIMRIIKVVDPATAAENSKVSGGGMDGEQSAVNDGVTMMEQVAALFGATEIVRNSVPLVEASFDGDWDEVKNWMDKGYHIESTDGRKHTALSEAAAQGHEEIVVRLLDLGANPNNVSDTGRSPLWRASFNGHEEVVSLLLRAGGDPDVRDRISMESVFDVAKTDPIRTLLVRVRITQFVCTPTVV